MLNYSLYNNHFTANDPEDRLARPVDVKVNSREDLIEAITGPGSILKPTETNAVINNYWQTITDYISRGEAYRDEHISTRFSISGVFQNDEDQFDTERHQVLVSVLPKNTVTDAVEEISLRRVDSRHVVPEVDSVYDWGSATNDDIITPDDVLEVRGNHLKLHDNVPEEGVFFVNQSNGTEAQVSQIRTNEPKTLTLRIPDGLAAGSYRLEVRTTRYDSDKLRTGIYAPELTVQ